MSDQDLLRRALDLQRARQFPEAQSLYEQILSRDPQNSIANNLLGGLHYQTASFPRAIEYFTRALAINPNYLDAQINLGAALQASGQNDQAIAAFETALKQNPNLAAVHHNLANAHKAAGHLDDAIASYQKAVQLDPTNTHTFNNLGIALKDKADFSAAVAAYQAALALNPNSPEVHSNLGIALLGLGKIEESLQAHSKAIALNPASPSMRNNQAIALLESDQYDAAISVLQRAIELNPDNANAHANLGIAYCHSGHFEQAIASLRRALALDPAHTEWQYDIDNATAGMSKNQKTIPTFDHNAAFIPDLANPKTSLGHLTQSPSPNLVIGTAWNLSVANVRIFIQSLRRHYTGDVMLLVTSQNSRNLIDYLTAHNVTPIYFDSPIWINVHLQVARYIAYAQTLRSAGKQYSRILFTDVTDVLFQADPFANLPTGELLFFMEDVRRPISTCPTNRRWIRQIYGSQALAKIVHHRISCSGTTIGSHTEMLRYTDLLLEHASPAVFSRLPPHSVGHDQGIHNYLLHTGALPAARQISNAEHVYTLSYVPESEIILAPHGAILAPPNRLCPIVHQYNYHPASFRHVRAAFDNH